jgi:hypothetical protein
MMSRGNNMVDDRLSRRGLLKAGALLGATTDFATTFIQDELRYRYRNTLFQEPARGTLTFRNNEGETALPMRELGSFLPATGVGGAGIHWNGQNWRFLPADFKFRSHNEDGCAADGGLDAGLRLEADRRRNRRGRELHPCAWGNEAAPVSADDVRDLRGKLRAQAD